MNISLLNNQSDQLLDSSLTFPLVQNPIPEEMEKKEELKEDISARPKRDASKKEKKRKAAAPKEAESYIPVVISKFNPSLSKRQLELEAYASVIAALRAQGELTWKKETLLHDLRSVLKISDERHRMELKQAEETLSQLNFPINRKAKPASNDPYDSESLSSDWESNSEEEGGKRKKQKTSEKEKQQSLGAFALPSTENQPASLIKVPKKAKKKESKKKAPKVVETKAADPTAIAFETLPPDILAAKETGDLEKLKEALQRHQDQVKAELAALNAAEQQ